MKIALRDDDLNYFYTPEFIENNIKDIWDYCPISMSVIPFVKGDWYKNTMTLEKYGPGNIPLDILEKIYNDTKEYDIALNKEVVDYIIKKINERKVYLTIHGIHHLKNNAKIENSKANFWGRAEFYTDEDLTEKLKLAVEHLGNVFFQKIEVFTPPQNLLSYNGFLAILNNKLNLNMYFPQIKNIFVNYKFIGLKNYISRIIHLKRIDSIRAPYFTYIDVKGIKIIEHIAIQPATNMQTVYKMIEYLYNKYGEQAKVVISTHSYGFNFKMKTSNYTIGEEIKRILDYFGKKNNVKFVTMKEIFED